MKLKAKCCKKYKRKSKACKRCPLEAAMEGGRHRPSRKALKRLKSS